MSKIERIIELCDIKGELSIIIHNHSKDARDESKLLCDLRRVEGRINMLIENIKMRDKGEWNA